MGKSQNHQFLQFQDAVFSRYVKTTVGPITGYRLDPANKSNRITFLLATPSENFDYKDKRVINFNYDDEVLEIYSEEEDKIFKRFNAKALRDGLFKPFKGEASTLDETNFLDDVQVEELAHIGNLKSAKKRIDELTSVVTLNRVLDAMNEAGRKQSFKTLVEERIAELNNS